MKKYYKIMRGWGDDFVIIEEKDLARAIYAQITGKVFIGNGTIAGNKIEMIVPDYHKTMGWNYGYKLYPEDFREIKSNCGDMQARIGDAGNKVRYLMANGKEHLIGTNVHIPELDGLTEPQQQNNGSSLAGEIKKVALKLTANKESQ